MRRLAFDVASRESPSRLHSFAPKVLACNKLAPPNKMIHQASVAVQFDLANWREENAVVVRF